MPLTPQHAKLLKGGGILALGGLAIWGMFKLYKSTKQFTLYHDILAGKPDNQINLSTWGGLYPCPGSKIMNGRAYNGTIHQRALAVSNRLHDVANGFWTWDGLIGGDQFSHGVNFLDQTYDAGECAHLVNALKMVLMALTPYGLSLAGGLAHAEDHDCSFQMDTYSGANNNRGFVSDHNGSVLKLRANVYGDNGYCANLYLWNNHKVLRYTHTDAMLNGGNPVFYDPNYARTQGGPGFYNNLADMAHYQITGSVNIPAGNALAQRCAEIKTAQDPANGNNFVFLEAMQYNNAPNLAILANVPNPMDLIDIANRPDGFTEEDRAIMLAETKKQRPIFIGPIAANGNYDPANFNFAAATALVNNFVIRN